MLTKADRKAREKAIAKLVVAARRATASASPARSVKLVRAIKDLYKLGFLHGQREATLEYDDFDPSG